MNTPLLGRILTAITTFLATLFLITAQAFAVADLNIQVTEEGQPLEGATISLTFPDGETVVEEDEDGDGIFVFEGLEEGSYFMAITPEGGEPTMTAFYAPDESEVGIEFDTAIDPQPKIFIDGVNVVLIEAAQPIEVGPKKDVGTESAGKKLGKSLVGGLLGGGGGSRSSSSEPRPKRDPARKMDEVVVSDQDTGIACQVRNIWTDDGLLFSTDIEDHPDKGTFQTVYLLDEYGNQLPASKIEIYKIWAKHTLTVSWTKSTYQDGNLISQESGGWSESWIEDLGTFKRRTGDNIPAIWQMAGYDRAHAGVRRVGTYFQLTPEQFVQARKLYLVIHLTMPKMDPVMTTPLILELTPGADGEVLASPVTF